MGFAITNNISGRHTYPQNGTRLFYASVATQNTDKNQNCLLRQIFNARNIFGVVGVVVLMIVELM